MKRKIMLLLAVIVLTLGMAACGEKAQESETQPTRIDAQEETGNQATSTEEQSAQTAVQEEEQSSQSALQEEEQQGTASENADSTTVVTSEDAFVTSMTDGVLRIVELKEEYRNAEKIVIPETIDGVLVSVIGPYAFGECEMLKSVEIPENVYFIRSEAFYGCSGLTSVKLPDGLSSIEASAFSGCSSLRELSFPSGTVEIGYGAFSGCHGLNSVNFANMEWLRIWDSLGAFMDENGEYITVNQITWLGNTYSGFAELGEQLYLYASGSEPEPMMPVEP